MSAIIKETVKTIESDHNPPALPKEDMIFVMRYRVGREISSMHFKAGNLQMAMDKGQRLCSLKRWVFVFVHPFIYDIDEVLEGRQQPPKTDFQRLKTPTE